MQLGLLGDVGPPRRKRTPFRTAAIVVLAANRLATLGLQRRSEAGRQRPSTAAAAACHGRRWSPWVARGNIASATPGRAMPRSVGGAGTLCRRCRTRRRAAWSGSYATRWCATTKCATERRQALPPGRPAARPSAALEHREYSSIPSARPPGPAPHSNTVSTPVPPPSARPPARPSTALEHGATRSRACACAPSHQRTHVSLGSASRQRDARACVARVCGLCGIPSRARYVNRTDAVRACVRVCVCESVCV